MHIILGIYRYDANAETGYAEYNLLPFRMKSRKFPITENTCYMVLYVSQ